MARGNIERCVRQWVLLKLALLASYLKAMSVIIPPVNQSKLSVVNNDCPTYRATVYLPVLSKQIASFKSCNREDLAP